MFDWIKPFFAKLFSRARKGLDRFIKTNLPKAVGIVRQYASDNADRFFHEYKDEARAAIKAVLPKQTPDNWVELLLGFAFEHVKAAVKE